MQIPEYDTPKEGTIDYSTMFSEELISLLNERKVN